MKYLSVLVLLLLATGAALAQTPPAATLTWTYTRSADPAALETDFPIQRKLGPIGSTSAWVEISAAKPGVLTYVDSTVLANVEYCYRVGARNVSGTGWSGVDCGIAVRLVVPNPPVLGLKMSQGTAIQPFSVSWEMPAGTKPTLRDWIALYVSTATDRQFVSGLCGKTACWTYTNGAASGTFTVTPPAAGTYNVRLLANDGYVVLARTGNDVVVK